MIVVAKSPVFLRTRFASVREWLVGIDYAVPQIVEVEINLIDHYQGEGVSTAGTSKKVVVKRWSFVSKLVNLVSVLVILVSLGVGLVMYGPAAYYHFFPSQTRVIQPATSGTPLGGDFSQGAAALVEEESYLPEKDESLPEGNWVVIPRIGVRTEMLQTEQPEDALPIGVWWVPDFGVPGDQDKPIILVAHRYGYKWWWKDDYWKYHSFNLLPELEPGDLVEVIVDQRKWTYEIYAGEEGEEITDYQADLILYTCKFLNSPIRHFRYARLVEL